MRLDYVIPFLLKPLLRYSLFVLGVLVPLLYLLDYPELPPITSILVATFSLLALCFATADTQYRQRVVRWASFTFGVTVMLLGVQVAYYSDAMFVAGVVFMMFGLLLSTYLGPNINKLMDKRWPNPQSNPA